MTDQRLCGEKLHIMVVKFQIVSENKADGNKMLMKNKQTMLVCNYNYHCIK